MRGIDQQYNALIEREAQSALHISDAALLLSESSRLVYAVLTEQDEATMRAALTSLAQLQGQFNQQIDTTETLVPANAAQLRDIRQRASAALAGLRVLLVDDNELNRLVATGLLESSGLHVDTANDGAEALRRLDEAPGRAYYDAVLMDMQMPVMDGLSTTRALRQDPRFAHLPVIAMNANAARQDIERTKAAGMNDHLSKPVLEERLWATLSRWLVPDAAGVPADAPPAPALLPAAAAQGPDQFIAAPSASFKHTSAVFFDDDALEELRGVFTADRFEALLVRFIYDCRQRLERIKEAHSGEDWRLLRQEAHELGGTVGSFGLQRLSEITRALEAAALEGHGAQVQELILRGEEAMHQGLQKLQAEREV